MTNNESEKEDGMTKNIASSYRQSALMAKIGLKSQDTYRRGGLNKSKPMLNLSRARSKRIPAAMVLISFKFSQLEEKINSK